MSTQNITDQEIQAALDQLAQESELEKFALQWLGYILADDEGLDWLGCYEVSMAGVLVMLEDRGLDAISLLYDVSLATHEMGFDLTELGKAVIGRYVEPLVERLTRCDEIGDVAITLLESAAGAVLTDVEREFRDGYWSLVSADEVLRAKQLLIDAGAISDPLGCEWLATGIGLAALVQARAIGQSA